MGIKEEIKYVKDELSSDEKLLENAFKLERFYKKHKFKLWSAAAIIVIAAVGNVLYTTYRDYRLNQANDALLLLEKEPKNSDALAKLQKNNSRLYALYLYSRSVKNRSASELNSVKNQEDGLLRDISAYHADVLRSKAGHSRYYHDLSLVEKAYLDIKAGNRAKARKTLTLVGENSPVANIARLLRHVTLKQGEKQ